MLKPDGQLQTRSNAFDARSKMDDLATAEYMTDRRLPGREDVKMTLAMSIRDQ